MRKRQFIFTLLAERDQFELLLNQIGFSGRMTMPGVCGKWSVKDMIAHVLANEQYIADRMHEVILGENHQPARTTTEFNDFLKRYGHPDFSSDFQDVESSDEWVIAKYKRVPLEEVVAQEVNAFNAIISAVDDMSDELLTRHLFLARISQITFECYRKHRAEIGHWITQPGSGADF